jgi:thioredoxin 1
MLRIARKNENRHCNAIPAYTTKYAHKRVHVLNPMEVVEVIIKLSLFVVGIIAFRQGMAWLAKRGLEGREAPAGIPETPQAKIFYFHSPGCIPCQTMGEIISQLQAKYPGQLIKVNLAEEAELGKKFGVRGTPTTLVVEEGRVIKAFIGTQSAKTLEPFLQ